MRAVRIYDRVGRRYEARGQVREDGAPEGPEPFVLSMREWLATGVYDRHGRLHHRGPGLLEALREKYLTGFTSACVVEDHEAPWGPAPDPWEALEGRVVRVYRLTGDLARYELVGQVLPDGAYEGDDAFRELVAGLMARGGLWHPEDLRRYRDGPRLLEAALSTFSKLVDHYALVEERDAPPAVPYPAVAQDLAL